VEKELRAFRRRVDEYRQLSRDRQARKLASSGIAGTVTEHPFGYDVTRLLMKWHPGRLEIDWEENVEDVIERLSAFLPLLIAWQENDTFDNDDDLDLRDWLSLARGVKSRSDLKTLMTLFEVSGLPPEILRQLFDSLELLVSWNLASSPASRTLQRVPSGKKFYQREPLKRRTADLRVELFKPPTPTHLLSELEGGRYVRVINEALAARNRELFPITFANPAEVYVNEPGRGVKLLLFGSLPEIRLPLESNFGAMLIRNGMPVGYGICAALFDRVEIAINVFPAFRAGESSFIIEQFFRLFYHYFNSRVFVVRSRQMGEGDEEALHSGSFWFYYKLGFRAARGSIRRLADAEFEKINRLSGYRSPLRTMKRLAKSDVFLHSDPTRMTEWQELSVARLGLVVTGFFAEKFDGDRRQGIAWAVSRIARVLGVKNMGRWSGNERVAFERLAPLLANISDLPSWADREKKALVRVIRSKGGPRERDYVLRGIRHGGLQTALERIANSYQQIT
jgi:hypothetical protein